MSFIFLKASSIILHESKICKLRFDATKGSNCLIVPAATFLGLANIFSSLARLRVLIESIEISDGHINFSSQS